MPSKPPDPDIVAIHTYWNSQQGFICPLCNEKLEFAFNDGGRTVVTLKGNLWIVTNYYRCLNPTCHLHRSFPVVYDRVLKNKKFGLDVWTKVIRKHFKYHMAYGDISEEIWDDWEVSISKSTVREICRFFETASGLYLNEKNLEDIKNNGAIVLSLDGAQPKKGETALWVFSDRLTGHILLAELLPTASAGKLQEIMENIERRYDVPIKAVISDKQSNIVKAVRQFNPSIPHVFCQYHFLKHIAGPIEAKDSHLLTNIRKTVRDLSIVQNAVKGQVNPTNPDYNPLYEVFHPLAEELLNSISVKRRSFDIFAGKESYENIQYILNRLNIIIGDCRDIRYLRTLKAVKKQLKRLISHYAPLYAQIIELSADLNRIRQILGNKLFRGQTVAKKVKAWVSKLQSRLKRRKLEYRPSNMKFAISKYDSPLISIWQEWIRLEASYHNGLYHSYDSPDLEKTNNAKEQLFSKVKHHFRKWLGKENISAIFQRHGGIYTFITDLDLSREKLYEILWANSVAMVQGKLSSVDALFAVTKRQWRIRTVFTGNWAELRANLKIKESDTNDNKSV